MDLFREYALLVAIAIPVIAVAGLDVLLWLGGERGTLLLPRAAGPVVARSPSMAPVGGPRAPAQGLPVETRTAVIPEAANETGERRAA